jgi:hypothetical protein
MGLRGSIFITLEDLKTQQQNYRLHEEEKMKKDQSYLSKNSAKLRAKNQKNLTWDEFL